MKKPKILVVEDEMIIADDICNTLEELGYEVTEPAINYTEAKILIEQEQPDLVILDIQLSGKKTGIDLAKRIREENNFPFVFLTSNADKFTIDEAKEVNPPAYLIKPYAKEELYSTIEITLSNFRKNKHKSIKTESADSLFVKTKKGLQKIHQKEILYIKSMHVYLDVVLQDGKSYLIRKSMNDVLNELNSNFIRTHRSYIVNSSFIDSFDGTCLTVLHSEIPVSKNYKETVLKNLKVI